MNENKFVDYLENILDGLEEDLSCHTTDVKTMANKIRAIALKDFIGDMSHKIANGVFADDKNEIVFRLED